MRRIIATTVLAFISTPSKAQITGKSCSELNGKCGRFCKVIGDAGNARLTAYKIAAFSAWMKIYQTAVLRALLVARGSQFVSNLFQKFDAYKVAASNTTVLRYDYWRRLEKG